MITIRNLLPVIVLFGIGSKLGGVAYADLIVATNRTPSAQKCVDGVIPSTVIVLPDQSNPIERWIRDTWPLRIRLPKSELGKEIAEGSLKFNSHMVSTYVDKPCITMPPHVRMKRGQEHIRSLVPAGGKRSETARPQTVFSQVLRNVDIGMIKP